MVLGAEYEDIELHGRAHELYVREQGTGVQTRLPMHKRECPIPRRCVQLDLHKIVQHLCMRATERWGEGASGSPSCHLLEFGRAQRHGCVLDSCPYRLRVRSPRSHNRNHFILSPTRPPQKSDCFGHNRLLVYVVRCVHSLARILILLPLQALRMIPSNSLLGWGHVVGDRSWWSTPSPLVRLRACAVWAANQLTPHFTLLACGSSAHRQFPLCAACRTPVLLVANYCLQSVLFLALCLVALHGRPYPQAVLFPSVRHWECLERCDLYLAGRRHFRHRSLVAWIFTLGTIPAE